MKRHLALAPALLALGCLTAPAENPPVNPVNTVNTAPVVEGNTKFALGLYAHLRGEKGNLFFSPYSISSALAMTYAGAKGDTATEMQKTLAFPAEDVLHPGFKTLNDQLNGDPADKRGYKLSVANRLWGQKGYPWNKEFLASGDKFYGAGLADVDFRGAAEQSRKTINAWVEKETQNKIKDLLKPGVVTADTRLVLTNAIYFKGDWHSQFKKDRTRDEPFKLNASDTAKVPMMHQTTKYGYGEDAEVQVLRLPYVGKELEMVVVLPKKVDGLAEVEKSLSPEKLAGWLGRTRETKVETALPKFKIESGFSLKTALEKLGMPLAFDEKKADFTGIATQEQLYISAVIHKAFVAVDEEGTEAAAATGVVVATPTAAPILPRFVADHPFLFLIRDTRSGSVLFLGRFVGP